MLRLGILGSGSNGNSAVIVSEQRTVLVDAGLSARQLSRRLELLGVDPARIDAVLLTHEHGDHVRGLDVFSKRRRLPVYCNPLTREVLRSSLKEDHEWRLVETGSAFVLGDLEIQTFSVAHDATDPMGFVVRCGAGSVGILSDVGYVTNLMRLHLQEMEVLFVESNYEECLLHDDPRRPWPTKQRILSRHGHLSNDQAVELVGEVASPRLRRVILGHLSRDCNRPEIALGKLRQRLGDLGLEHVMVDCAGQSAPVGLFDSGVPAGDAAWEGVRLATCGDGCEAPNDEVAVPGRVGPQTAGGIPKGMGPDALIR
ncbi:MAG TPA: MBL fold metallo-hydrolase [Verrucomicrobiales bacterium]|nr:MBL fold metallo-hydrolase [Verrucomicrobiales bacterium]